MVGMITIKSLLHCMSSSLTHPHDQHANKDEEHGYDVLEDPRPGVPHEVQSPLVDHRQQVPPEVSKDGIFIVLRKRLNGIDVG